MPASLLLWLGALATLQDPAPRPEPSPGARFGYAVCALPDVDKDGTPDFAVSAPYAETEGNGTGVVVIFSGATREAIRTLSGHLPARFGGAMHVYDDLDEDGIADLLVAYEPVKKWQVVSSADGRELATFDVTSSRGALDRRGGRGQYPWSGHWPLAPVGDLNEDGRTDLVAGTRSGVDWISGADGSRLRRTGDGEYVLLSTLPDSDGDSIREAVVGRPHHVGRYYSLQVEVHQSTGGEPLNLKVVSQAAHQAGDLDGDGASDIVLDRAMPEGPESEDPTKRVTAGMFVYSSQTGRRLLTCHHGDGGTLSARAVLGGEDLDGDLVPDLVWANHFFLTGGDVVAFSGKTQHRLWRHNVDLDSPNLGTSMSWLPDQNGDGVRDILSGGCDDNFHGVVDREGAVWILSGADGSVLWRKTVAEVLGE